MDPLWLFALLSIGIMVVPGMDMAFVLSSSLVDGARAGLAAVAGLVVGGIVHVAMGSLGVGWLLQNFPTAFNVLLLAGAAYVAWMGWMLWRHPATLGEVQDQPSRALRQTFGRAVMTCLLNPKAYVFMVAVFPGFLATRDRPLWLQAIALGAIVAVTQAAVYGAVALGAGGLRQRLRASATMQIRVARSVAALLIATAAWTVWQGWSRIA